jgi:hypothetical protein
LPGGSHEQLPEIDRAGRRRLRLFHGHATPDTGELFNQTLERFIKAARARAAAGDA